jgi:hypothetical protein
MLTDKAKTALTQCYATRGPHKGQLLARCPPSATLAAAAWQGAMIVCNPYRVGVATIMFMSPAQREIYLEVHDHFDRLPKDHLILAERNREALENLGVW